MVGVTKRRVQAGRRNDDFGEGGGGSKQARMEGSTEEVQKKLHRHFNETAFMQGQWRGSLSRVALALSAVLVYRLFYLWTEGDNTSGASTVLIDNQPPNRSLLGFLLGRHAVETLGVPLGLCISRFVTAAAPSVLEALPNQQQQPRQAPYQYPASFYAAAALSALELLAFARTALTTPGGYALHIDASFPVGAAFFLFVWASDRNMRRGLDDAKLGLEASRRLSQAVNAGGGGRAKAD